MQKDAVLDALAQQPYERSVRAKDYVADLISWELYDEQMRTVLAPYLYQVLVEVGAEAIQDMGLAPSQYDPYTPNLMRYQDERSTKIAKDVNDETEKQLRASITEGLRENESAHQIRARIESVFGFAVTERADRIAQTEITRAQTFADVEAWDQSGVVSGKEWYTAKDERVCPWCRSMDGQVVGLNTNFFDKGDEQVVETTNRDGENRTLRKVHDYDNVIGPPNHVRCRCVLLPVRK